jgi:hypothetical protein
MDLREVMRKDLKGEINNGKSRFARCLYGTEVKDRCQSVFNG